MRAKGWFRSDARGCLLSRVVVVLRVLKNKFLFLSSRRRHTRYWRDWSSDVCSSDLSLTVIGEYPVPVERLWEAYADPRQLERFWGPETWPATFTRHDMTVGGRSEYHMTGPDGSRSRGWWRFLAVEPVRRFEVEDGFSQEDGSPSAEMPTMRMVFAFEPTPTGSRLTSVTHFASLEAMEQLV